MTRILSCTLLLAPVLALPARAADKFELRNGDRVVLVGSTLVEREQRYGYWETALTARYPNRDITFRNLGWSGDTVFGDARAGFGTVADGFRHLKDHVLALKPTVIVLGYGTNESFAGRAGLANFERGLNTLLDTLAPAQARIVLLSPLRQENLGPPLPDPAAHNRDLRLYVDAIRDLAKKRSCAFVDLYNLPDDKKLAAPLTDNGLHPTAWGYWFSASVLEARLGLPDATRFIEINTKGEVKTAKNVRFEKLAVQPLRFQALLRTLPLPPQPGEGSPPRLQPEGLVLRVKGLPEGKHTLRIDGKVVVTAPQGLWNAGVFLPRGADMEQAERLRQAIVAKNRLYFHRWRPQNETYLFGFRKHEQGRNAREIPQFDPLVAAKEKEIARLRKPVSHRYELTLAETGVRGQGSGFREKPPASSLTPVSFVQRDAHIPDPDPEAERKTFKVADGFEVNLFAADPLLAKPIQMNFDPAGRLWIASSEAYPQIKPGQKQNDKIIVLEDTRGVGKADKTTVFAEGLLIPTGLEPGDGGVYVANSTDLLHLADNGKGKAGRRRVVLSGFGTEDTHHLVHTLRWGPDALLYFNQAIYIHSHIETPHGVRRLNGGGIWQLRPESLRLEVFARGWINAWGHDFDRYGQSFVTDGAGGEGVNYVVPGASYPTAVGTPRILHGLNPGSPKYCGCEILSGRHLPEEWRGNLLTNDFRGHRVCRFVLKEDGTGFAARQLTDLISSSHPAFRPIDVKMGPDGAIYIADWYNPIIQHGEVDFRDPRRDHTHGRIWRVTAKGRPLVPRPKLVGARTQALLEALKVPEDWTRLRARRVLKERGRKDVLPALAAWVGKLDPKVKGHEENLLEALWTYQALDVVEPPLLATLLKARDHRVRAAATRVVAAWEERLPNALELLAALVRDEHPRVRMEAVRALGKAHTPRAAELALCALDKQTDQFLDYAVWLTLRELEPLWLPALHKGAINFGGNVRHLTFALQAAGPRASVRPLVELVRAGKVPRDREESALAVIAALGSPQDLGLVLDLVLKEGTAAERKTVLLEGLARAARQRRVRPAGDLNRIAGLLGADSADLKAATVRLAGLWHLEAVRPRLNEIALAKGTAAAVRQAVLEALVALGGRGSQTTLEQLAGSKHAPEVRRAAVAALAGLNVAVAAKQAAEVLASSPADADPSELVNSFLQQKKGAETLAAAVARRKLPADVAKIALRTARASGRDVTALADALTRAGGLTAPVRVLPPKEMEKLIAEVARRGSAARGEAVYRRKDQACLKCHAIGGAGGQVGPDLVSIGGSAQVDYLIDSLLQPNKQVKEGYHSVIVTTKKGQIITGVKVREANRELILRNADDQEVRIPVNQIDDQTQGNSLMPEGLTDTLTRAELVDLVRFLSELGKAGPYQVGKERVVRRWQTLEPNRAAYGTLSRQGQAAAAANAPGQVWAPAYSTVAGTLPVTELPSFKLWAVLEQTTQTVAFVRCQLEVTTPGKVKLLLNAAAGLKLWVDGAPAEAAREVVLDLKTGLHTLTVAVDVGKRRQPLRVEVVDVAGSPAQVRVVGGK